MANGVTSIHISGGGPWQRQAWAGMKGVKEAADKTIEAFKQPSGEWQVCVEDHVFGVFDLEQVLLMFLDAPIKRKRMVFGVQQYNGNRGYFTVERSEKPGDEWYTATANDCEEADWERGPAE